MITAPLAFAPSREVWCTADTAFCNAHNWAWANQNSAPHPSHDLGIIVHSVVGPLYRSGGGGPTYDLRNVVASSAFCASWLVDSNGAPLRIRGVRNEGCNGFYRNNGSQWSSNTRTRFNEMLFVPARLPRIRHPLTVTHNEWASFVCRDVKHFRLTARGLCSGRG